MFDLKQFRKDKRLTQGQICSITGYSQSGVSNIERGAFDISPEALDVLIEKFGDEVRNYITNEPRPQSDIVNENELKHALQEIKHLQNLLEEKERLISVLLKQNDVCDITLDEVLDVFTDDAHNNIKKFSGKINEKKGIIYIRDHTGEVEIEQYLPKKTTSK